MVVGNGLLGKAFKSYVDDPNVIIFASGVSNSTETNQSEFEREFTLLKNYLEKSKDLRLIYFSTCSIYNPTLNDSLYVQHKARLEKEVISSNERNLVLRLSNVVGSGGNPNTIFNFLKDSILQKRKITLWRNAERNLIDIEDVSVLVHRIIKDHVSGVINLASPYSYSVLEIFHCIEEHLGQKGNVHLSNKGSKFEIDISNIRKYFHDFRHTKESYLEYLIERHCK